MNMNERKYCRVLIYLILPLLAVDYALNAIAQIIDYGGLPKGNVIGQLAVVGLSIAACILLNKNNLKGVGVLTALMIVLMITDVLGTIRDYYNGDDELTTAVAMLVMMVLVYFLWMFHNLSYFSDKALAKEPKPESTKKLGKFFLSWLVAIFLIIVSARVFSAVSRIGAIIVSIGSAGRKLDNLQLTDLSNASSALSLFFEAAFAVWLVYGYSKTRIVDLDNQGISKQKKVFPAILVGLGIAVVVILLDAVVLKVQGCRITSNPINNRVVMAMLWSVPKYIGVAAFEEVVSRGLILGYCEKHGLKIWGVVLSSIVFVALHFITGAYDRPWQAVFLLGLALALAAIKLLGANIWMCIGFHFLYDWAVMHLIEMTMLNNKQSFFSVLSMTYKKQALAVVIPSGAIAMVLFILCLVRDAIAKKRVEQNCN